MSIVGRKRRSRQRGGRHKYGYPPTRGKVKHHIVLDDEFMDIVNSERREGETNQECLWRMLRSNGKTIMRQSEELIETRKKVDALEYLLEQYQERPTEITYVSNEITRSSLT